jgi:hypothetical protein
MNEKPLTAKDIQIGTLYQNNAYPGYLYLGTGDVDGKLNKKKKLVIVKSGQGRHLLGVTYNFQKAATSQRVYDNFYIVDKELAVT